MQEQGGEPPQHVQVPVSWVGMEEVPVLFINMMLGQIDDHGDAIIAFGQTTPPALIGTPQEVAAQAARLAYVPVKPIARVSMSRPRLAELIGVLQQLLAMQENVRSQMRQAGQGENL